MEKQKRQSDGSKNLCKKGNVFLYFLGGLAGIVTLFFVTLYVFAPTYRFDDPKPFSGDFINNPYQNLTDAKWNYIDLRNDDIMPTYEYGRGLFPTRYLCVNYESERKIDYPFLQNIHLKQYNINCLNKKSSLVVPTQLDKGFKLREMKHLDNYRAMEVVSSYGNYFNYWDLALSSGRRVNIVATDSKSEKDGFVNKTVINADLNDIEQIINSLKNGDSYAISYLDGNLDLPELKSLQLTNDTIVVEANKLIKTLRFIGQNGVVKDSLNDVNQGVYAIKDDDSYIRVEMSFEDETMIYLNPIVRHQFQYFFDPSLSVLMKERTWLMRIIYVFVIIFFVKYLLSNKKEEVDEDKGECNK